MAVPDPRTMVRSAVGSTMRSVFATPVGTATAGDAGRDAAGDRAHGEDTGGASDGDAGLFGPDSVTWRIHADLSMLVGGVRALIVQTLHPLAIAGVAQHSRYESDPLGRLRRTAAFVATTTYGTTTEADEAVAKVRSIHEHVRGVAPDGRPYAANDPDLLAWVHHVEVQSFLLAYQRIGPGLSGDDADRYVREMAVLGARMGARTDVTTAAGLHDWVRHHPDQQVTAEARAGVRFLARAPLPLAARGPYAVMLAAAISLVPLRQRLALGLLLPGPIAGRLACEPAARALLGALGWSLGPSPALERAHARVGA